MKTVAKYVDFSLKVIVGSIDSTKKKPSVMWFHDNEYDVVFTREKFCMQLTDTEFVTTTSGNVS